MRLLRAVAAGAALVLLTSAASPSQEPPSARALPRLDVPLQPLAQNVRALATALGYLGQPLPPSDLAQIDEAIGMADERASTARLQEILDKHALVMVDINPESRVKVVRGVDELLRWTAKEIPGVARQ